MNFKIKPVEIIPKSASKLNVLVMYRSNGFMGSFISRASFIVVTPPRARLLDKRHPRARIVFKLEGAVIDFKFILQ